jgi:mono/diheme cytochrome c family protein
MSEVRGAGLAVAAVGVPDYALEVAPLLQKNCVTCHRPGDIGSFAMTNHAVVAGQAASIKANLLEGIMPPWHADAPKGVFTNDFSLQPAEVARLLRWVDAGAPKGGGGDPLAEVTPATVQDWPMGTPDKIVRITRQNIPAKASQAEVPYRYAVVASPFTTNVWLRAAVVRPGNRKVVHHALIFTGTSFADVLQVQAGLGGFFAGYVPGMDQREYPAGTAKFLKKGSFIVFQMHYTPVETAQSDATEIGLYLMSGPPEQELKTGAAYSTVLSIPPGASDAPAAAEMEFARPVTIYELSPHMHYRGKRMRFEAVRPDGSTDTLLNVPAYDFAWQAMYRFTEPRRYPAGTRIRVVGAFDNSVWNPFNPDPAAQVEFGEQTNDEMFIGYVNYSEE